MKTVAFVGNVNRFNYYTRILAAKDNGHKVYDLMNTSEEQVTQDLLESYSLVVIGDWYELPQDARDIIGLAQIIGKPVRYLNDVPADFQKACTINFCMSIADGLISSLLGEND